MGKAEKFLLPKNSPPLPQIQGRAWMSQQRGRNTGKAPAPSCRHTLPASDRGGTGEQRTLQPTSSLPPIISNNLSPGEEDHGENSYLTTSRRPNQNAIIQTRMMEGGKERKTRECVSKREKRREGGKEREREKERGDAALKRTATRYETDVRNIRQGIFKTMISMLNYLMGKVKSMYGQMGKYEKESNGNARGEINIRNKDSFYELLSRLVMLKIKRFSDEDGS